MKKLLLLASVFCAVAYANAMEESKANQLMDAIRDGNDEIALQIIEDGVDINEEYYRGSTMTGVRPLICAILFGRLDIAKELIERGAKLNFHEEENTGDWRNEQYIDLTLCSTPLHMACEQGHQELVELLIKKGANVNAVNTAGHSPLHAAVAKGALELVKILVNAGAEINTKINPTCLEPRTGFGGFMFGSTSHTFGPPLCGAIAQNRADIVRFLVENGAEVNPKDNCPLAEAYCLGNNEILAILKNAGAKITNVRPCLLWSAAKNGMRVAVALFTQTGMPLDATDRKYKATPLLLAANNGHTECCELLVMAGADLYAKNRDGHSAGDCAEIERNKLLVLLMQRRKNNVPIKNAQEYQEFLGLCEKLRNYGEILDILESYQKNPVPLKYQCINQIRKLVKEGELKKEKLPKLDEFGFHKIIVPKENDDENNNNNNEDEELL